jgi:feruloyl esterase
MLEIAFFALALAHAQPLSCEDLLEQQLPDVRINAAAAATDPIPLCKVDGVIGERINFSVWLPASWNGKFVMGGQGGFAGSVASHALDAKALEQGYAVAGGDTGHQGSGVDGRWALYDLEAIANYGSLATHRTTETAKFLISAFYGHAPSRSYFAGCSNGGRQGLMSADRYPDDFDGIIAGAPVVDFTAVAITFLNAVRLNYPDPRSLENPGLGAADLTLLGQGILEACDSQDGLNDAIVSDPDSCNFDPSSLICRKGEDDACILKEALSIYRSIHDGRPLDGGGENYAFPFGAEQYPHGWGGWLIGAKDAIAPGLPSLAYAYGVGFARNFVMNDPEWSYMTLDSEEFKSRAAAVQKTLSPVDATLIEFRSRGGKLLMYHGWADAGLSPYMSIEFINRLFSADDSARNDVRLFMMPGMFHCSGGPGPDQVNFINELDKWVESGNAPADLPVSFRNKPGARKLCAYPAKSIFLGKGDGDAPDQFACE